jgi:hypothetical protein
MQRDSLSRGLVLGTLLALLLVIYGVFLTPSTRPRSIAAATSILIAYAALGYFVVPACSRGYRAAVDVARWAGLAAAAVFTFEICLEYLLLPQNNSSWGAVEFGLVFFIYFAVGAWLGWARRSLREATLGSALSALIASLVWCIVVLTTFYLFHNTARQQQVFQAEGNFDDFRRSGMSDFSAFITEDFFGATFFHLLLGPVIASLLGFVGGAVGKGLARLSKRY